MDAIAERTAGFKKFRIRGQAATDLSNSNSIGMFKKFRIRGQAATNDALLCRQLSLRNSEFEVKPQQFVKQEYRPSCLRNSEFEVKPQL